MFAHRGPSQGNRLRGPDDRVLLRELHGAEMAAADAKLSLPFFPDPGQIPGLPLGSL